MIHQASQSKARYSPKNNNNSKAQMFVILLPAFMWSGGGFTTGLHKTFALPCFVISTEFSSSTFWKT